MTAASLSMDGMSRWAWSSFSRIKVADTTDCIQHVVCRIPRDAFRQSAMTFGEIKQSSPVARYWNMSMQLFLEMIRQIHASISNSADAQNMVQDVFQKVYLEWIPSEHDVEKACEYRLHAFLFTDETQASYGNTLHEMLKQNNRAHEESLNRSANSRRPDTLAALNDHQVYLKVTREVYFRNVCGLANGHRKVENNLDAVNNHNTSLAKFDNIANPVYIWSLKNACSNCRNPEFRDDSAHILNGKFHFLDTKRVIRLSPGQYYTKTFTGKFLPDYQAFVDDHIKPTRHVALPHGYKPDATDDQQLLPVNNKDAPVRDNDDRLDMNVFGENDISTLSEQEQQRLDAFTSRSDFALMSENAKNQYIADVQPLEGTTQFNKRYMEYKNYEMEELKARCLNPDANISEKGKVILKWMERRNPPSYKKLYRFDRNLSVFANRVIKIMEEAEQYFLISTAHREFYQVMHARLDAYRRDFGLHLNIFQTGEGATSKSFLFDLMKECSIPGTIDQLTYETAKANAVDGNRNDVITVCHEAPPGMFRTAKNRNMDSSAEAMFKERLTSNHVSCKTYHLDEATGRRSQRTTKSECIGVWMGATNDPQDEVEEALKTRFHWGNFEKIKRPGKDIDDCINGERALSRTDKLAREEVILEWREEQARVFLVEKMIWCNIIKDVEMSAFYIIKQKFKKLFDGKSVREAETRDWQRIYIFARIQAITTALATVFQVNGNGLNYYGQDFDESQLLAIESHLVCTEEMVYFTLTMMDSQFVHPAEHKILRKIYHEFSQTKLKFGNPTPDDTDNTNFNFNYVKMPGTLMNISNHIQSIMGGAEGKTSANNIKAYLLQLCRASVKSRNHVLPDGADEKTWPTMVSGGREQRMTSAYHTGDALYIHVKLLQNHKDLEYDPVLDTIMKIEHTHQASKTCLVARRYIYPGVVFKQLQYHIFRTIQKEPVSAKVVNGVDKNTIKYTNVLHNSDESKLILGMDSEKDDQGNLIKDETRQRHEITIAMDIDTWAKKQRAENIGADLPDTSDWGKRTDIRTICYPTGMCKGIKKADEKEATRLGIKIPAPQTFLNTPTPAISKKRKAVVDAVGDTNKNQRVVY